MLGLILLVWMVGTFIIKESVFLDDEMTAWRWLGVIFWPVMLIGLILLSAVMAITEALKPSPKREQAKSRMPHDFEPSHAGVRVSCPGRGGRHLTDEGWRLVEKFVSISIRDGGVMEEEIRKLQTYLRAERATGDDLLEILCLRNRNQVTLTNPDRRYFQATQWDTLYAAASATVKGLSNEDTLLVLGWARYRVAAERGRIIGHLQAQYRLQDRRRQ